MRLLNLITLATDLLIVGVFYGMFIIVLFYSFGCASVPRQFNSDDMQDQACYAKYGGLRGFCDSTEESK